MTDYPVFQRKTQDQLKQIGRADLVIGLPTYKNPGPAAATAQAALAGARQYFPDLKTVLINADIGYSPTTRQAVLAQSPVDGQTGVPVVSGRYRGRPGYGSAVAALLDAALALDARAIVILDTSTASAGPAWIPALSSLVLENRADLVTPRYHWALPEGSLSDLLIYPLSRALWGTGVRHPAAPDFALSPRLATTVLDEDVWQTEVGGFGLPPWLTAYALLHNWRVAQTAVGEKKSELAQEQSFPQSACRLVFGPFEQAFYEQVSVLFRQVYRYRDRWDNVAHFQLAPTLTRYAGEPAFASVPERDPAPFLDALALGWIEYRGLWQNILTPDNLSRLEQLAALPPDRFYFPADLWARIVYDFVVVFNWGDYDPYRVAHSLYPIFLGRLAAFWQETAGLAVVGYEGTVAAQAVEFEEARSYLKIRWHTYPPLGTDDFSDEEHSL